MISYSKLLELVFRVNILMWIFFPCSFSFAQITISGQINNYTSVSSFSSDCRNVITVDNPAGFSAGTHVLLLQMQGATINESNSTSYGEIIAYNGAGLYEKAIIQTMNGNEITLAADLVNAYDIAGKVQLVTLPQYSDVIVSGPLTAAPWNGATGGVLALEASGTVTLNASISVDGMGFRGGNITNDPNNNNNCNAFTNSNEYYYASNSLEGAFKGEGIAEFINNKELGRGAQANGGGGGNNHNSGGGGGANYGTGGRGGNNNEPGIFRCKGYFPGLGGEPARLDNRVFLGGGGGGGHTNNNVGTPGGNGGGIIYLKAGTLNGNGRTITANGISAREGFGDGGGGGGAGGSILLNLNASNPIINGIDIQVQGGNGATIDNQNQDRCFGPGGGGGGGLVASTVDLTDIVSGIPDVNLEGGEAGLSNNGSCNNSTNGATNGGAGTVISSFVMPMGTIITGDLCKPVPTPVDFIQFTAKLDNGQVKLEWITASETNNNYFAVERSDDNTSFTQIMQMAGSGTTADIKKYQAVDGNPLHGISYYRIRQVDFDGKFSYSKVVAVANNQDQFAFTVYPNPVQIKESLYLKIYMPEEETVQIQVIDLIGKMVFSTGKHLSKGQNTIELNAVPVNSGIYFIYVKTSKGYKTQKIKVVK